MNATVVDNALRADSGPLVLTRATRSALEESAIGGKAAGLELLVQSGARVPPYFVVSAAAFRAHLRRPEVVGPLEETLLLLSERPDDAGALETATARMRAAIESAPLSDQLRSAIEHALREIGSGPYAVRSSMVGEDSGEHSFAGQLRTELFQPADHLVESIRRCWAAAFEPTALAYAARVGVSPSEMKLALVIQSMVDADVAGVAFSANPVTGSRSECVVSAAYGLGAGVVGDLVAADEYVWSSFDGERSASVADKETAVCAWPSGPGTDVRQVSAAARRERALTPDQVAEVAALARTIENVTGGKPMDLEWCFSRGVLYALQARPITALPLVEDLSDAPRLFDNANIQESFNGVTTPLTFSFAVRIYAGVYGGLLRALGVSERAREQLDAVVHSLLALIDGRVYYNLDSWRDLIAVLPHGRRRVEEVETIMFRTTIGARAGDRPSARERLRRAAASARVLVRLTRFLLRQDAEVDAYVNRFERFYHSMDRAQLAGRTLDELRDLLRRFGPEAVRPAATAYLNDVRMAIAGGRLRKLLARVYDERDLDARLTELLGGIEHLESVEPTRRLIGIADEVRRDEVLTRALQTAPPSEAVALIRRRSSALAARIDAYLERYGDRTIGELKLETPSLRDDPRLLGQALLNYLGRSDLDHDAATRAERERAEMALRDLRRHIPHWRGCLVAREVRVARKAISCRERLRLRRTWAFALARDVYRAIGSHLHTAGQLDDPRDVFYLSAGEIDDFLEGRAVTARLAPLVAQRKAEYDEYARTPAPDRLQSAGTPYLGRRKGPFPDGETVQQDGGELRGVGCCAGVVEAPVRVIVDGSESLSLRGEILCTIRTDPGWAPLFPTVGGLIIERGSTLSHSAVVARELGIPTVVGVPGATRTLTDGERVRLDGTTGVIERVSQRGEG